MIVRDLGNYDFGIQFEASDIEALVTKGTAFVLRINDGVTFEIGGHEVFVRFPQPLTLRFGMWLMDDVDLIVDRARSVRDTTEYVAVKEIMEGVLQHLGVPT